MIERVRTSFRDTFRTLRTLVLEVIGGFFLALAVVGAVDGVQNYRRYVDGVDGALWRVILDGIFFVSMLGFGLHSFWRSRKIRR